MTAICNRYFKSIFINDMCCILIQMSPKFVPKDLIDNKSASFQILGGRLPSQYSEPKMTYFIDAYKRHSACMGLC